MSPIRKSDDLRAVQIDSWQEYIDEEIEKLVLEGELNDLPDQGKPIKIWRTDVNPEHDLAFSRLKNAGIKPLWMELDQEIGERTRNLWARLDAVEATLRSLIVQMRKPADPDPEPEGAGSLWERFLAWFRDDISADDAPAPTVTSVMALRERERNKFLEDAGELDKKIDTFHNSLPKGAEHLQRLRWLPARAAREFDDRIRLAEWWDAE